MKSLYRKVYDRLNELDPYNRTIILPESNFKNDLGLDSLDWVELILWSEETFNIDINDEELMDHYGDYSVEKYASYIESKLSEDR